MSLTSGGLPLAHPSWRRWRSTCPAHTVSFSCTSPHVSHALPWMNVVSRVRQCSQNTTESAVHLHRYCKWKHMNCYTSKAISLKFVGETLFIQMRTSKTPLLMYVHAHKMKYICIVLFSTYSILTGVWSGAWQVSLSSPSPPLPPTHYPLSHTGGRDGAGSLSPVMYIHTSSYIGVYCAQPLLCCRTFTHGSNKVQKPTFFAIFRVNLGLRGFSFMFSVSVSIIMCETQDEVAASQWVCRFAVYCYRWGFWSPSGPQTWGSHHKRWWISTIWASSDTAASVWPGLGSGCSPWEPSITHAVRDFTWTRKSGWIEFDGSPVPLDLAQCRGCCQQ